MSLLARTAAGRHYRGGPRTVVSSAARTTNGDSAAVSILDPQAAHLSLVLDVSTSGGGGDETLDVSLLWSDDGSTFAVADGTTNDGFTQVTTATNMARRFDVLAPYYRIDWTVQGTTNPSFTFAVAERVDG